MKILKILFAVLFIVPSVWAQLESNQPHIGYLYPAGAQQGTTVTIHAGGQYLRGAEKVYVSGDDIEAKVLKYMKPVFNLNKEQREAITDALKETYSKRVGELPPSQRDIMGVTMATPNKKDDSKNENKPADNKEDSQKTEEDTKAEIPDHPLLYDLEHKSIRELAHIRDQIFMPRTVIQPNRQLAENVMLEVTVSANAKPGPREIRILTKDGLTNPIIFEVGLISEHTELEPNDTDADEPIQKFPKLPEQKPLSLPVVINGQIRPGDVDHFKFYARQGQKLVIDTHARSLIPYLADAVPGWFQATVAMFDSKGNEIAFADDFRFNPDPVIYYEIQHNGEYQLVVRDSIYRGREDFVYRVSISEQPFITQVYPLGAKTGKTINASISGWNLPSESINLDTSDIDQPIRKTLYYKDDKASNLISYEVDDCTELDEGSANDSIQQAQTVFLPSIVNGRIEKPGDIDVYKFIGLEGDSVVAEVYARRLNSPLDSIVRITDEKGKVIEWNDDYVVKDASFLYKDTLGVTTHHADSYLTAKLPEKGTYYVHITDSQNHGSSAYAYRLRISRPEPDFELRVTPSSLNIPAGGNIPFRVHALRKDGFEGPIIISLKDAPEGIELHGEKIPTSSNSVRMTIRAPYEMEPDEFALKIQGTAVIDGKIISHTAAAADDMMQAFLYRHLVPCEELMVSVRKKGPKSPYLRISPSSPVEIPLGGAAMVTLSAWPKQWQQLQNVQLALYQPPAGIKLAEINVEKNNLTFMLCADKDNTTAGLQDNVIIEAIKEYHPKDKDGNLMETTKTYSMGAIPAIPIKIVASTDNPTPNVAQKP